MDSSDIDTITQDTLGIFTAAMAQTRGISAREVAAQLRKGEISRVCGRGLMLGAGVPTIWQRAVAGCLTWPDATVCFRTAARIHGFPVDDDGATHVLVPNGRKAFGGLTTHHWNVGPAEIEVHGHLRVTDRRTTLADCLGRLPDVEAWGLLAWLWTRDLITHDDVEAQIAERKGLYGIVRLRKMAAALRRGAVSPAEIDLQDFLVDSGFTGWLPDQKIFVRRRIVARADILFVEEGVILEYDGRLAHPKGLTARDKVRQRRLRDLGYHVIRVRWERLVLERGDLVDEILLALAGQAA